MARRVFAFLIAMVWPKSREIEKTGRKYVVQKETKGLAQAFTIRWELSVMNPAP